MQRYSDEQAEHWCGQRGLGVIGAPSIRAFQRGDGAAHRFRVAIKGRAPDVVALAHVALMAEKEFVVAAFPGGLLWLRRWEIGSEEPDRVGYVLLGSVGGTVNRGQFADIGPAFLFERDEFAETLASLCVPMLFQWDADFIAASGRYRISVSHHQHIDIESYGEQLHSVLYQRFQDGDFSPEMILE